MPRPKNGYENAAGEKVPGVHDVTGRYGDKNGLIQWAYKQGTAGVPLYEKSTYDIGTVVHNMAELDLRGAPEREINAVPHEMLSTAADIDKAWQAFRAFQAWRKEHHVQAIAFEESLVSETFQYGGTFDVVAFVDGVRGLIDFKTCKDASKVYLEQRIVLSAHANLWREKHPDLPIAAYHLINLPKDGSRPGHHAFANLSPEFEMFTLQLDCWRIEKGLTVKRTTKPKTVVLSPQAKLKAELAANAAAGRDNVRSQPDVVVLARVREQLAASKPRRTRKPKLTVVETPTPASPPAASVGRPSHAPMSMAELLRSYGHVPEMA